MEIVGVTASPKGDSHVLGVPEAPGQSQVLHDVFVMVGQIAEILHQATHDGDVTLESIMVGKIEIAKLLDLALAMGVQLEMRREAV